jgi:hypothetical protein
MHYEPEPYMPQKDFSKRFPKIKEEYEHIRNRFKVEVHNELNNLDRTLWKKSNQLLALATAQFQDFRDTRYENFVREFLELYSDGLKVLMQLSILLIKIATRIES